MNNNRGWGSGLALILIMITALFVAWLAVTQMSSLGDGRQETQIEEQDPVDAAQDIVNQLNEKITETGREP